MSEMGSEMDGFAESLKAVAGGAEAAAMPDVPTEPSGENEARLRKPDAKGTPVKMANSEVVLIPVVAYTGMFFMDDDGRPDVKYKKAAVQFHDELEVLLSESETTTRDKFDIRRFYEMLFHIFKENYPDVTVDDINAWLGAVDINDEDGLVTQILATFWGMSKN